VKRRIIDLDAPDRFVAGALRGAGGGAFFLQAARGPRVVTIALQREQMALLADRMLTILDELERRGLVAIEVGADAVAEQPRLAEPLREEFAVGTLTIAWDDDGDRVIVEAHAMLFDAGVGESAPPRERDPELEEIPDDDPIGPDVLRVRLTPAMAQRFARHAGRIAAVG
jgi:uncharacterized repeat protein (TIGR03847 family)